MKLLVDVMPIYAQGEEGGELDTCWTPLEIRKEKAFRYRLAIHRDRRDKDNKFSTFVQRLFAVSLALFLGALLLGAAV